MTLTGSSKKRSLRAMNFFFAISFLSLSSFFRSWMAFSVDWIEVNNTGTTPSKVRKLPAEFVSVNSLTRNLGRHFEEIRCNFSRFLVAKSNILLIGLVLQLYSLEHKIDRLQGHRWWEVSPYHSFLGPSEMKPGSIDLWLRPGLSRCIPIFRWIEVLSKQSF